MAIGEYWIDRVHNMYLEWLVAAGLTGFLVYLFFLGSVAYVLIRQVRVGLHEKAILLGLLTAYLINNLFSFDTLSILIVFLALVAFIHLHAKRYSFSIGIPSIPKHLQYVIGGSGHSLYTLA